MSTLPIDTVGATDGASVVVVVLGTGTGVQSGVVPVPPGGTSTSVCAKAFMNARACMEEL